MIERNIFQIWKTEKLPYYLKGFAYSWKKQKGFNYFLYTDESMEEFVNTKYKEILPAYSKLKIVEKTDLFRLILVYEFGGIYADMDTICQKNLNILWKEHSNANILVGVEADTTHEISEMVNLPRHFQLCNWTFAAKKGNTVIKKIIDRIIENIQERPHLQTLEKTGPAVLTDVVIENKDSEGLVILPIAYFGSGQRHSNSPSCKEGFVVHHFLGSWKKDVSMSKKIRFRILSWFITR